MSIKLDYLLSVAGVVALVSLAPLAADGAGFAIAEQSVKGLGSAFAGGAAIADDATTVFYNPAGMTRLPGRQSEAALHIIVPSSRFENTRTTFGGATLAGNSGGNSGTNALVPNLYYSHQLGDSLWLGVGLNAPFGLVTKYDAAWVGRYHAIKSDLLTLNVNPSVAYKVNDFLSVGAGVSVMYADAELTQALFNGTPLDGFARVIGDDIGFGVNAGVLITPISNVRLGVHYRSMVELVLKGDATFTRVPLAPTQNASAALDLPDSLSTSVHWQVNPQWAVYGDATYTRWDRLKELRIRFNGGAPDSVVTLDWENTWRLAGGIAFSPSGPWTLRAGYAFDETPVPSPLRRTPRVPDSTRNWLTVGASYRISDKFSLNFAYAHLFVQEARIDKVQAGEDALRGALRGNYDADVNIFSGQVSYKF
jgi:long-chain fatty acid transport protein